MADMLRSYFTVPNTQGGIGTRGTPRDMVVANHYQKKIWGVVNGGVAWERITGGWPRAMRLFDGVLYYADSHVIYRVDPATGSPAGSPWVMPAPVVCLDITQQQWTMLIVGYGGAGAGKVEFFNVSSGVPVSQGLVTEHLSYPRAVHWVGLGGVIAVADTFGHKVKMIHLSTGKLATNVTHNSFDVYYPNDVRPIGGGKILVAAEHENRIITVNYNTGDRELVFAADIAPYNDIDATRQDIVNHEPASFVTTGRPVIFVPPKQEVAKEYADEPTCYAPNCAFFSAEKLVLCDTDHHRVLVLDSTGPGFRDWVIETEVTGFDMPVSVVLL